MFESHMSFVHLIEIVILLGAMDHDLDWISFSSTSSVEGFQCLLQFKVMGDELLDICFSTCNHCNGSGIAGILWDIHKLLFWIRLYFYVYI